MPFKGKTKQEVVAEFRNAEILDAARRVFADKGFRGASVEDIAVQAGVAKGTLYLYYRSKRDIYWAALQQGLLALYSDLKARVDAETDLRNKIRAYIGGKISHFEANLDFFRIYHAEFSIAMPFSPEQKNDIRAFYFRQVDILRPAIERAVADKAIRPVPAESAALGIVDLARGITWRRLWDCASRPTDEEVAWLVDFIWKGLAADE